MITRTEREILLMHLTNCSKLELYTGDIKLGGAIEERMDTLIKRRLRGEPLQYILGYEEFMGMNFIVTKDVFIPRPETEILVEEVLNFIKETPHREIRVLDICTGSGNIAISLARSVPYLKIYATDISSEALEIAQKNALLYRVEGRVRFYQGDLFDALVFDKNSKFDIITTNPPYIPSGEISFLQKELSFEPSVSLDGGRDGLDFYRRISKDAYYYLKKDGSIFMEVGFGQAASVSEIFSKRGYTIRKIIKDTAGIDRVIWTSL